MSPIPSLAAFASNATLSAADTTAGQPAPVLSQHVLTTGGLLFVAVAVVTLVGYFHHGRRARTENSWTAGLRGLLSSLRPHGSVGNSGEATADLPTHPTIGFEHHVNMVYARHFHPTFWNLVEAHAATLSAPAIIVEDEATEVPASEQKPFGMNSFLSMDGDEDEDENENNSTCEKPDQVERPKVKTPPPYDTGTSVNLDFRSDIIGSTVRTGAFLTILGMAEDNLDDASEGLSSFESILDLYELASEETMVVPPVSSCSLQRFSEAVPDPAFGLSCSASQGTSMPSRGSRCRYDGVLPSSTSLPKRADSSSQIITATSRPSALPPIQEEPEVGLAESSSFNSYRFVYNGVSAVSLSSCGTGQHSGGSFDVEMDSHATRGGIVTTTSTDRDSNISSMAYDDAPMHLQGSRGQIGDLLLHETGSQATVDSARDVTGDPGILPSISGETYGLHEDSSFGSELDYYFLAYDETTPLGSSSAAQSRRHGIVDMTHIAESLKVSIPETVHTSGSAIPSPSVHHPSQFVEMDSAVPSNPKDFHQALDGEQVLLNCDIDGRDRCDDLPDDSYELEASEVRDECHDLMRRLLEELRDPNLEYIARSLSEDSVSIYSVDDEHSAVLPPLTPTLGFNIRRNSPASASSTSGTETESSEGQYPFTPPSKPVAFLAREPDDHKARIRSLSAAPFTEEVQIVLPTSSNSPPASPPHPFFRTHRDSLFLYGSRSPGPTVTLPRF